MGIFLGYCELAISVPPKLTVSSARESRAVVEHVGSGVRQTRAGIRFMTYEGLAFTSSSVNRVTVCSILVCVRAS